MANRDAVRVSLDQADMIKRFINQYPDTFKFASSAQGKNCQRRWDLTRSYYFIFMQIQNMSVYDVVLQIIKDDDLPLNRNSPCIRQWEDCKPDWS